MSKLLYCSVQHAALISWDHVLNVDECIFTSVDLEKFKRCLDEFTQVLSFSLAVVNLVSHVSVLCLHEVEDWQNLAVVWHQGFSNGVRAGNEGLQDLKSDCNNLNIACVQSR